MAYTASGLIAQARSIADLQNSKFVTLDDEVNLLNESYRDVYNRYTESSGDYWTSEQVITLDASMIAPDSFGRDYYIPVPVDFYKLRSVSYQYSGQWVPMQSFAMSNRDNLYGAPQYRMRNNTIWIRNASPYPQVKIQYYTPPAVASLPADDINFLTTLSDYQRSLIATPSYVSHNNSVLYIANNGTEIRVQSTDAQSDILLLTTVNVKSQPRFYRGYIYWIELGDVWRAPTDFVTTLTPVKITTLTGITQLSVFSSKIWYTNAANTYNANLDGTGQVVYVASVNRSLARYGTGAVYINVSNQVVIDGVVLAGYPTVLYLASDGTYIYTLTTDNVVHKLTVVAGIVTVNEVIRSNIGYFGPAVVSDYLVMVSTSFASIAGVSTLSDTVFTYPSNEVNEIMAYTCAVAFVRKKSDDKKMSLIQSRLDELWGRFETVIKRDEYQVYRINDDYQSSSGINLGVS